MNAQSKNKGVLTSSLSMAKATMISRVFGLVREQVMAFYFGASGFTDAFMVAFRIPNMLRDLFAEGAFTSAFVPEFSDAKIEHSDRARELFQSAFILLLISTSIISLLIIYFAPELIDLMTDDLFTSDAKRFVLTVGMTRITAPFLTFVSLAALCMGVLNTYRIFFLPAIAPAFFNLSLILSTIFLRRPLESFGLDSIYALAVGAAIGGFLQFLVQLYPLYKKGYFNLKYFQFFNKRVSRVLSRFVIGTFGVAATEINVFVMTLLATSTLVGAVSWLSYAFRIFQLPVGVISVSLSQANLAHFSDAYKRGDKEKAKAILQKAYIATFLFLLPLLVFLFNYAGEVIELLFYRGKFDQISLLNTSNALRLYLTGLPFYGIYKIFGPTFFALDRPKLTVAISAVSICINVVLCLVFVPRFGFLFLAFGVTLTMFINAVVGSFFLKRILSLDLSFFLSRKLVKLLLIAFPAFVMLHFLAQINLPVFLSLFIGFVSLICFYLIALSLTFKISPREFKKIIS